MRGWIQTRSRGEPTFYLRTPGEEALRLEDRCGRTESPPQLDSSWRGGRGPLHASQPLHPFSPCPAGCPAFVPSSQTRESRPIHWATPAPPAGGDSGGKGGAHPSSSLSSEQGRGTSAPWGGKAATGTRGTDSGSSLPSCWGRRGDKLGNRGPACRRKSPEVTGPVKGGQAQTWSCGGRQNFRGRRACQQTHSISRPLLSSWKVNVLHVCPPLCLRKQSFQGSPVLHVVASPSLGGPGTPGWEETTNMKPTPLSQAWPPARLGRYPLRHQDWASRAGGVCVPAQRFLLLIQNHRSKTECANLS